MGFPFTLRAWAGIAALAAAALAGYFFLTNDDEPTNPYSALTTAQFDAIDVSGEVYVPRELPDGLEPDASRKHFVGSYTVGDRSFRGDELPFYLHRVEAARDLPVGERELVAIYTSAVLGESSEARFEVRQTPEASPVRPECARPGSGIERLVGAARILICADELGRDSEAWDYWSTVAFTSDLDQVFWLRNR